MTISTSDSDLQMDNKHIWAFLDVWSITESWSYKNCVILAWWYRFSSRRLGPWMDNLTPVQWSAFRLNLYNENHCVSFVLRKIIFYWVRAFIHVFVRFSGLSLVSPFRFVYSSPKCFTSHTQRMNTTQLIDRTCDIWIIVLWLMYMHAYTQHLHGTNA